MNEHKLLFTYHRYLAERSGLERPLALAQGRSAHDDVAAVIRATHQRLQPRRYAHIVARHGEIVGLSFSAKIPDPIARRGTVLGRSRRLLLRLTAAFLQMS